jgi:hypothetical protein
MVKAQLLTALQHPYGAEAARAHFRLMSGPEISGPGLRTSLRVRICSACTSGAPHARYNSLGRTGLIVSELCIGTMTFGGSGGTTWGTVRMGSGSVAELCRRIAAQE